VCVGFFVFWKLRWNGVQKIIFVGDNEPNDDKTYCTCCKFFDGPLFSLLVTSDAFSHIPKFDNTSSDT